MGCHFLLQGIFPIQGSNWCLQRLLHWQADSLPLSHLGSAVQDRCPITTSRLIQVSSFWQLSLKNARSVYFMILFFVIGWLDFFIMVCLSFWIFMVLFLFNFFVSHMDSHVWEAEGHSLGASMELVLRQRWTELKGAAVLSALPPQAFQPLLSYSSFFLPLFKTQVTLRALTFISANLQEYEKN